MKSGVLRAVRQSRTVYKTPHAMAFQKKSIAIAINFLYSY